MPSHRIFFAGIVFISLTIVLVVTADADDRFGPSVVGNGGTIMTGPSHELRGTVGQVAVGGLGSVAHIHGVGFWYLLSGPAPSAVPDVRVLENRLDPAAPNPFNPSTSISFALARPGRARIGLYDLRGRLVAWLVDEDLASGEHVLNFTAKGLASGIYLYRLEASGFAMSHRITLVK